MNQNLRTTPRIQMTRTLDSGKHKTYQIVTEEAREELFRKVAELYGPRDAEIRVYSDSVTVRVERAWGVEADVYIRIEREFSAAFEAVDENDKTYRCHPAHIVVEYGWSSTHRSGAQAAACVKLYQEMLDFGNTAECVLAEFDFTMYYAKN